MKKMLKIIPAEEPSGITLDYAQVQKNPGRKATAKLMLNSFWGKFGERQTNLSQSLFKNPLISSVY